jgi:hypothetical protein
MNDITEIYKVLIDIDSYNIYNVNILTRDDIHFFNKNNEFSIDVKDTEYIFNMIPIRCIGNVLCFLYCKKLPSFESIKYNIIYVSKFLLKSPGIIELYGERYVTIHCDEIENHLRGSLMYNNYSPGMALVNMGVQGYSQSRNDFYGVTYKEFHPIGKLNNLKFSVKRPDGELYDFKNINWHMLLSIKYYVPKNTRKFSTSTLNPNYVSNFLKYQLDRDALNRDSDTDSEPDDVNENVDNIMFRDIYRKQELELLSSYESEYESELSDDIS